MASILKVDTLQKPDGSTPTAADLGIATAPLTSGDMPAGTVLQVLSATKTDTQVIDSGSYIAVAGLSVTITPKSTSSKILVSFNLSCSVGSSGGSFIQLTRNGTAIGLGTDANSNPKVTTDNDSASPADGYTSTSMAYMDSPATTSAITYAVQGHRGPDSNGRFTINRSQNYPASTTWDTNGISTITVYEIAQ